jgi:hypothetical protein
MAKLKTDNKNYALPGLPMTQQELELMVQEAEKGPFHSLDKVKETISKWKSKHAK